MATINWNDTFLTLPDDENNPGRGAEAIRNFKVGIDERVKEEHFIGEDDEVTLGEVGGRHREGTARARVVDEAGTARDTEGSRVLRQKVGSLNADMTLLGSGNWRKQATVELDDEGTGTRYDNRRRTLQIYFTDSDDISQFIDVFNPDHVVSMFWDQTIQGDKVFARATKAPADTETAAVTAVTDSFNPSDAKYATNFVIPANVFWKWLKDSKFHNVFDFADTDNAGSKVNTVGLVQNPVAGTTQTINRKVCGTEAYFDKVYGAVYG